LVIDNILVATGHSLAVKKCGCILTLTTR